MGSMTAHIAIGWEDTYHAGLAPSHTMWLHENSRPAWILKPFDPSPTGKEDEQPEWATEPVTWIPSRPEQILADGILLLACRVLRDETTIELAEDLLPDLLFSEWVELEKLDDDRLAILRENCEEIDLDYKLVITVLGGSSLESQLPVLEQYPMNVEVCTVTYSRLQSAWNPEVQTHGSLTASWASDGPTPDRYREINFPTSLPAALAEEADAERAKPNDPDQPTDVG